MGHLDAKCEDPDEITLALLDYLRELRVCIRQCLLLIFCRAYYISRKSLCLTGHIAHFVNRERPRKGEPARPIVIRIHSFQACNEILRHTAQLSPLTHDGNKLSIFADYTMADYTTAVVRKRAAFRDTKCLLHSCPGVKFGLLFPAVLQITLPNSAVHKFNGPVTASDFIKKNCLQKLEVNS